ncbi:MAG TPA: hypothetical protein VGW58_00495 [Pyrinomonadaceae bacterium]|nr:hypothetical protein [Pyrinomonadaceae bacterium]
MTSILSSISGYFSKSLILGTFLPVAIFTMLALILFVPYLPPDIVISSPLEGWEKEWRVIGISFVVIVVSGLIYNLNIPILRLYEGYPWRSSLIGSWLRRRERAKFDSAQLRLDAMRAALRAMEGAVKGNPANTTFISEVMDNWRGLVRQRTGDGLTKSRWFQSWRESLERAQGEEITAQWQAIDQELRSEFSLYRFELKHAYPDKRALIMPTRLGNVIRSFEYYSQREYGIDSNQIWPRLAAVIPEDYAISIDDTKTTFDFMMNCSLLSAVLSFCVLIAGLVYPAPFVSPAMALWWLLKIVALVVLSYFFYRLSINRAHAWGLLVKSAFDLFRWDLLKKLGYAQIPKQRKDERALWTEISRQAIFGDRFDKKSLAYSEPAPAPDVYPTVRSSSARARFEITRGVKAGNNGDSLVVYVRVKNADSATANGITVWDRLSDDLDFEWDSARLDSEKVHTSGINPYQFHIGNLVANREAILTYGAIKKDRKEH